MWSVPVRFLVMWAPIVAVSVGGGIYIYECVDTLLAPGTGFTMDYATPGGNLKIECANYSVDLLQQTVYAKKLVIKKEDGSLVARVPLLVAKGIALDDGLSPKVQIKDAELWVNRNAKGDIDVLSFLSPSEGGGSKQTWQISLRDTQVHFFDETVQGGVRNHIKLTSGNFVGMGDETEGAVELDVLGLAAGRFNFKKQTGFTVISSPKVTGKLEAILNRLRAGQERKLLASIQPLSVSGGTFEGDFRLEIPEKKPVAFRSKLTANVNSARWADYRSDALAFDGIVTDSGLTGKVKGGFQGSKIEADGVLAYSPKLDFAGNLEASNLSPRLLDSLKIKLPKGVSFRDGKANGTLTYHNDEVGWNGDATITAPAGFGLQAPVVEGHIALNQNQLVAKLRPIAIGNTVITANIGLNLKTQALVGAISTPDARAKDFSKWLPSEVLESRGRLAAIIDGTLSRPNVLVKGSIDPRIKLPDQKLNLAPADVVLRYDGTKFHLDRAVIKDPVGELVATGTIDLKKGINVRLVGNDINLAELASQTSGKLDVQAQIFGPLSNPTYSGKVQGFNVNYAGLPGNIVALATDFIGDKSAVKLKRIEAMQGASQITGNLAIGFEKQTLNGLFAVKGVDIRDLYDGPVGGVMDLNDITVGGTFALPRIDGTFEAKKILAYNFAIDSAVGSINYDGENLNISKGFATLANGTIRDVSGAISAKTKSGKIAGTFEKLDLNDVVQSAMHSMDDKEGGTEATSTSSAPTVKGTSSGSFEIGLNEGTFASLTSKGRVDDFGVNKAFIGAGEWGVDFDGSKWGFNAFIGSLDDFFRIDNAIYKPKGGEIGGEFLSYKVQLDQLLLAAEPSLGLSAENVKKLHLFQGDLGSLLTFSGTVDNPIVDIEDLELSGIKLGETDLGKFSIKGRYANKTFTFRDGLLLGPKTTKLYLPFSGSVKLPDNVAIPDGTARLDGSISADRFDVTGSVFGFPVSKFKAVAPSLANVNVFVDRGNFQLKGTKDMPVLSGSVSATAAMTPDGQKPQLAILGSKVKLNSTFSAQPNSDIPGQAVKVDAAGDFSFGSLQGIFSGGIYLASDFAPTESSPVKAHVELSGDRDAGPFLRDLSGIAVSEGGASVSGGLDVSNTYGTPLLAGGFTFKTDSIKYTKTPEIIGRPIDLSLTDVSSSVFLENDGKSANSVRLKAFTRSNYSAADPKDPNYGSLAFDAKLPVQLNNGEFKLGDLDGSLTANGFSIYQSFMQGSFLRAQVDTGPKGPIKLTGSLEKPKISGDIYFDNVRTVLPTLNATNGASGPPIIDPTFDLRFFASNPMNIRTSLVEVNTKGQGTLKGSLSNMKAEGNLVVDSGQLTLPGGVVKLSPDGTLDLKYDNTSFNNRAQLFANLKGETSLTALKNGVSAERYDISISIEGDLLATNGLQYDATSRPAGLDKMQIQQLLGRTDILTNILQSGVNSNTQNEIKNALAGYALPGLLNGLTGELGKGFGLDYFGVDYNAFEQASLSFVKNLGSGLYLQGRRQLFQPLPGQPQAFDYRLSYRPRFGPDALRAFSFSFGADQLRPYKLSIDYSGKIRTSKRPYQTINLHVPHK